MASVYRFLKPEDKLMIETMWKAMFEGLAALFYNLAQAALAPILPTNRGYLETAYETLDIYNTGPYKSIIQEFDVDDINVTKILHIVGTAYILAEGRIYQKCENQAEY